MKIMDNKYVVADPETLRALCIDHSWFTCGSNEQYNKLFDANRIVNGYTTTTISDIAWIIWMCSEAEHTWNSIFEELLATHRKYLATGERIEGY